MLLDSLGIVVIGRNEGERLKTSIRSLPAGIPVVYVDSGSTDRSPEWAEEQGHSVIRLSTDRPFSAARARNEGLDRLLADCPDRTCVQFIDGDCELDQAWLSVGLGRMAEDANLAAVAGLRRERYPEKSWYNELCAYEWDTPIGLAKAVGGDALYRIAAFQEAGGFDPLMMAGEEPELCLRLRRLGYQIERLDAPMTLHDAAIYSFGAWWKRAVRSGYASTLGAMKHGRAGYRVREVLRSLVWGGMPAVMLLAPFLGAPWLSALLLVLCLLKWWRLKHRYAAQVPQAGRYAAFTMMTNVAEVRGVVEALWQKAVQRQKIVEYK
ncbi:MAG: glycosyltransferase family 2 protein [Pseudomonadota bacterium]